jgi:fused signal recognition particle receptor
VLDASQGQNLIEQVRLFHEALQIDSLIITKLDGSSKAGTIFQISRRFGLPIDFCGVGEGADDLLLFDPQIFVDSLWGAQ